MKKIFFLFSFVSLNLASYAQGPETNPLSLTEAPYLGKHRIGVNTTFFVKQFLNFSNTNLATSPYLLTYDYIFNGSHALRAGLGIDYSRIKTNPDNTNTDRITSNFSTDVRIGWAKYLNTAPTFGKATRWVPYVGADLVMGIANSKVTGSGTFGDDVVTRNNSWSAGLGGVAGMTFRLSHSVSLGTETSFYARYSNQVQKVSSTLNPFLNTTDVTDSQTVKITLPTTLYLIFHFG